MNWTREKPTEAGWYWLRGWVGQWGGGERAEVVEFSMHRGELCINRGGVPVSQMQAEWAGPLVPPQGD